MTITLPICVLCINAMDTWRPPSLSELTAIILYMELTYLSLNASIYCLDKLKFYSYLQINKKIEAYLYHPYFCVKYLKLIVK